jgi:hypothetical protein
MVLAVMVLVFAVFQYGIKLGLFWEWYVSVGNILPSRTGIPTGTTLGISGVNVGYREVITRGAVGVGGGAGGGAGFVNGV